MEYLFIYLLQIMEGLLLFGKLLCVASFIVWIIKCICSDECTYGPSFEKKFIKIPLILLVIGLILQILPTKQTLLLMGGTYLGKKAVNAVVTDEKIKKVDTIINLQLDKYIKELQGKEVK